MYLQRNTVNNNKARSDIREASGFVITTEPLGFVITKQVNDFILRVLKLASFTLNMQRKHYVSLCVIKQAPM